MPSLGARRARATGTADPFAEPEEQPDREVTSGGGVT